MLKINVVAHSFLISLFLISNVAAEAMSLEDQLLLEKDSTSENKLPIDKDPELENRPLVEKYSLESDHLVEHLALFVTMHALIAQAQAEGKPEIADFVGRNTFGNNWVVHFEVAKRMHEINGYGDMPLDLMNIACNLMQTELLRKASTADADVHVFLRRSFDERLATHSMHRNAR